MAVPRVFVSSTYYDLKQYRSNIADFIKGLGYEPIMHERSGVAYTQKQPLETDCYHELASCDIVVCIIGNHFGSQSSESDLSITMEELNTALKYRKKIYVFIAKEVYIENKVFQNNRDSGSFKPAFTDDIRIHEFITELTKTVKNHMITDFETTDDIISVLKAQFAGLLQNYLAQDSARTEAKTAYDLQETADRIRNIVDAFSIEKDAFFEKFDCTVLSNNLTLTTIKQYLGLSKSAFFAKDKDGLDEILRLAGYSSVTPIDDELYRYQRVSEGSTVNTVSTLSLYGGLFDSDEISLKPIRLKSVIDTNLRFSEEVLADADDDELPF